MTTTIFAALAEPSRMQLVELLRERPYAVGDLAEAARFRQPQTSKHLQVLRDAGVVSVEQVGRRRIHHLRPEGFQELAAWLASFERVWDTRLDALGRYLERTSKDDA